MDDNNRLRTIVLVLICLGLVGLLVAVFGPYLGIPRQIAAWVMGGIIIGTVGVVTGMVNRD